MAAQYIPIKRISSLDAPITAEKLNGSLFTTENQAHEFIISVRKNGEKQTVTGSVSGKFIRANGTTIFLQGSIVDGDAVVRLHQDCYNVQGRFTFNVFNTQSGVTTCIYSAVGKIDMGSTETMIDAGDVVPDVSDVVAAQEAAQAAINAANTAAQTANTAATNVGSIVARPYSSSSTYTAGKDYCTYNGNLYKANQDISTAEEWTASHWTQIVMGDEVSDLKSAFDHVEQKIPDGRVYPFAIVDKYGKAAVIIDSDGRVKANQKYFAEDEKGIHHKDGNGDIVTDYNTSDVVDFAVCDKDNRLLFYVKNGTLRISGIDVDEITNHEMNALQKNKKQISTDRQANFDSELNMFIAYGQSWSVGYDAPAITLSAKYDNIMFNTGIKNNPLTDTTITPTSFVPMVEYKGTSSGAGSQVCGETPVSAMCNTIKQLIEDENGYVYTDFPYQMLGNAPGMGDRTLAELKKGTTWYNRLISQVRDAYSIAAGLGKKLVVQAFSWQQLALGSGISTTYAEALEQLRSDIDADVKAITGQTQDVKCITWQTFNRSASGAAECYAKYVGASETYPNIICSGASYQFRHVASNNLHLISSDNDWAGAYFGVAYKRSIIDGEKFIPLKPISATVNGKDCILTFNVPQKPLVFDTTTVASVANKGFTLLTSDGTEKPIASVDIVAPDKIRIRATSDINNSDRIAYAQNAGTNFGPVNGNRGNVRDSQGDYIQYQAGDGTVFDIHNWLVVFDKTLSTLIGG